MRLDRRTREIIKREVSRRLGEGAVVRLFGSRVVDSLRGGDIDLLVETDAVIPNRAETLCQLHGALTMTLGDRKLDILLKDAHTADAPIFEIAKRTGVLL